VIVEPPIIVHKVLRLYESASLLVVPLNKALYELASTLSG